MSRVSFCKNTPSANTHCEHKGWVGECTCGLISCHTPTSCTQSKNEVRCTLAVVSLHCPMNNREPLGPSKLRSGGGEMHLWVNKLPRAASTRLLRALNKLKCAAQENAYAYWSDAVSCKRSTKPNSYNMYVLQWSTNSSSEILRNRMGHT